MIPALSESGYLPPGVHPATWSELEKRFGTSPHRRLLLSGLLSACSILSAVGCETIYLDGSFVSSKPVPGDFDVLWDPHGVDILALSRLEPVFLEFGSSRAAQKAKYLGEFFPATMTEGGTGRTFLDFFQTAKDTGEPKGIVALNLRGLP